MSTPPTSASPDRRQRVGRTAPRRHVEPVEVVEVAKYDGGEFPVLLRLPDILREEAADTNHSREGEVGLAEGSATAELSSSHSVRSRQRRHADVPPTDQPAEKNRFTADAAQQFWTAFAPKIAVGGMLLAVTALCIALLQGQRGSNDADQPARWASDPPLQSEVAPRPQTASGQRKPAVAPGSEAWSSKSHSVAAKPSSSAAPLTTSPAPLGTWSGPASRESAQPTPAAPLTPARDVGRTNVWLPDTAVPASSSSAPRATNQPSQGQYSAQGWPDELEQGPTPAAREMELDLNSAARVAPMTGAGQQVQTSLRETMPPSSSPSAPVSPGGARLNGTVELPNLGADYTR